MATADLTVLALGRPDASASEYIAEIQRHLAAQDRVSYRMHAMGTSLEGAVEDDLWMSGSGGTPERHLSPTAAPVALASLF